MQAHHVGRQGRRRRAPRRDPAGLADSVDGNIQSEGHRSTQNAIRNRVKGDIQLFSNPSGTKYVYDTSVDGNLQCKSNTSAPKGWDNTVRGTKEDQCRRL
ncbi:hypothetical protein AWH69_14100 [Janibacter melonis]|uniref:Uncharacterized protein n=1 Tax=Janibacter melonis TaxID=262209 RepID=A0A176Q9R8_9MICO|nr:hypothetical protein [Janibacter melonis]OAB86458.1 hypothetical protein AWH69_14100 [Janibacter melonis]